METEFYNLLMAILKEGWSVSQINFGAGASGPETYQVKLSKLVKVGEWTPGAYTIKYSTGNGLSLYEALCSATDRAGVWNELNDRQREDRTS